MKAPFVRSAYNYDPGEVSDETGLEFRDASLAKQEFGEDGGCSIYASWFA